MRDIDRDLDRILRRLRTLIPERGFTQLEVQEVLGWGRSYISQLLTRQKAARIDQVLVILKVLDVDPGAFFAEIYRFDEPMARSSGQPAARNLEASRLRIEVCRLRLLADGLVRVLQEKELISTSDLARAIEEVKHEP